MELQSLRSFGGNATGDMEDFPYDVPCDPLEVAQQFSVDRKARMCLARVENQAGVDAIGVEGTTMKTFSEVSLLGPGKNRSLQHPFSRQTAPASERPSVASLCLSREFL